MYEQQFLKRYFSELNARIYKCGMMHTLVYMILINICLCFTTCCDVLNCHKVEKINDLTQGNYEEEVYTSYYKYCSNDYGFKIEQ